MQSTVTVTKELIDEKAKGRVYHILLKTRKSFRDEQFEIICATLQAYLQDFLQKDDFYKNIIESAKKEKSKKMAMVIIEYYILGIIAKICKDKKDEMLKSGIISEDDAAIIDKQINKEREEQKNEKDKPEHENKDKGKKKKDKEEKKDKKHKPDNESNDKDDSEKDVNEGKKLKVSKEKDEANKEIKESKKKSDEKIDNEKKKAFLWGEKIWR